MVAINGFWYCGDDTTYVGGGCGYLLAIGAAALMLGAGIGLAAAGMSMLVGEIAQLDGVSGVGVELLLIAAGIGALALAITALGLAMINPLGMIGGAAAMGVLWALT